MGGKMPSKTYGGTAARMPTPPPPSNRLFGTELPSGGARPRTHASIPSGIDRGKSVTVPKFPAAPPAGPHISETIRKELPKLTPALAAGVRRVAKTK